MEKRTGLRFTIGTAICAVLSAFAAFWLGLFVYAIATPGGMAVYLFGIVGFFTVSGFAIGATAWAAITQRPRESGSGQIKTPDTKPDSDAP